MEAVLPIMLAMAMETERFTRGRGKELATQDTMILSIGGEGGFSFVEAL